MHSGLEIKELADSLRIVWVRRRADIILIITPTDNVMANPLTMVAPSWSANQNYIKHVIKVDTLLSLIAGQALLKPIFTAIDKVLPVLNSSFNLSNIRIFASTAMPIESIAAAIPLNVKVTDNNLNTAITMRQ